MFYVNFGFVPDAEPFTVEMSIGETEETVLTRVQVSLNGVFMEIKQPIMSNTLTFHLIPPEAVQTDYLTWLEEGWSSPPSTEEELDEAWAIWGPEDWDGG